VLKAKPLFELSERSLKFTAQSLYLFFSSLQLFVYEVSSVIRQQVAAAWYRKT
jgi:hypothetical protein